MFQSLSINRRKRTHNQKLCLSKSSMTKKVNLVILWEGDSDRKTKNEKVYLTQPDFTANFRNSRLKRSPLIQTKNIIPTTFSFCKSLLSMICCLLFSAVCVQSNPLTKMKRNWKSRAANYIFHYSIMIGRDACSDWLLKMTRFFFDNRMTK